MKEKIDNIIEKGRSYLNSISQYDEQNVLNLCSDDEHINSDIEEYLDGEQLDLRNLFYIELMKLYFQKKMDHVESQWKMSYRLLEIIKMLI